MRSLKTTGQKDEDKAIYTKEWTLQLAPYRFAEERVLYGLGPRGTPVEIGTTPWEPIDRTGIVHLRGAGQFTLYEVQADRDALAEFLAMANTYAWTKGLAPATPIRTGGLTHDQ